MKFFDYLKTYHTNIRQELGELQEVEEIGILQPLLRQIRLRWRQRDGEVADRLALPVEEIAFNPHGEYRSASGTLQRLGRVPA